jgi:putative heme-binding domain-containing protein
MEISCNSLKERESEARARQFALALQPPCRNLMHRTLLSLVLLVALSASGRAEETVQLGLRVPAGFEVTEYADAQLANDIYTLALDPQGRVVVAGRGYIRVLVDNGAGRAERTIEVADGPKDGAMGLLWEDETLYVVGDGGLRRLRVREGRAAGPSELLCRMNTGGEHAAHALRRGPDGWLYLLCGDHAGIDRSYAKLTTSPIKAPVAGCVLRFPPEFKGCEIVADGFRNPYSMDFNADGELFTFDSDNERCVSLPWYEPIRFYHVIPGRHYGWLGPKLAAFWRLPPYVCDVVAPVATFGRGSPTGVACYRQTQFPTHYHGGFFLCDWTFGRVYFAKLRRVGTTYTCQKEVFLQAVGENGFAPTGIVVHPKTGDLFISIGGRGTRGAVYRIHYKANGQRQPAGTECGPRPHSVSRGLRPPIAKKLANWNSADRLQRAAAADRIAALPAEQRRKWVHKARTPWEKITVALAVVPQEPTTALHLIAPLLTDTHVPPEARLACARLVQLSLGDLVSPALRGTVWEGYSPRRDLETLPLHLRAETLAAARRAFPSGHADLDRELARILAMMQDDDPGTLSRLANVLATTADPVEQTHYLIVLGRLKAPRPANVTAHTAEALLGLDRKLKERRQNRDSNWPLRIEELYAELSRRDPALNAAILSHKEFGRPDHVLFTSAPGFDRRRAARLFLARAREDKKFAWNADLVRLVGTLPAGECLPTLRRLWGRAGLEAALLPVLAREPRSEDRGKFLLALGSPDLAAIRIGLQALERLPEKKEVAEIATLVGALGRLPASKEGKQLGERLAARLRKLTAQDIGPDRRAWAAWLGQQYPNLAARLSNPDGVDVAAWQGRLGRIPWSAGDADRGRAVFVKAGCAACHSGSQALGPDLQGVAGRFSREDLFTAIVQPSKDVSPRYRTTLIETSDGKTYQGLVIYESVDGVLLQTATGAVRLTGEQIVARRSSPLSLMPAGLLEPLSDRDVADLYAYLRRLGGRQKK